MFTWAYKLGSFFNAVMIITLYYTRRSLIRHMHTYNHIHTYIHAYMHACFMSSPNLVEVFGYSTQEPIRNLARRSPTGEPVTFLHFVADQSYGGPAKELS